MSKRTRSLYLCSAIVGSTLFTLAVAGCGGAPESSGGQGLAPGEDPAAAAEGDWPVRVESDLELSRMKQYVESLYPRASIRHSFKLPSGAPVDCVDVEAQPGLARPGMEGLAIASPPPQAPLPAGATRSEPRSTDGMEAFLRPGETNADGVEMSCPAGTIPILKPTVEALVHFRTLEDMWRKVPIDLGGGAGIDPSPEGGGARRGAGVEPPRIGSSALHQYAHAAQSSLTNYGAHAQINVWSPYVQSSAEFSLGQIWVARGSGSGLQTLEVGNQKYQGLYNDTSTHLFIYSTSDGYNVKGCYNLSCGRFVQTNNAIVIGGGISPVSTDGGTQYEMEYAYYLYSGNWWLSVNGTWVGYYPGNLFNAAGLANGASVIDFGGEIVDDRTKHASHTATDMGSGAFPSTGFGHAAYERRLFYYANNNNAYWATGIVPSRTDAYCYDVAKYDNDPNWGTYIFYGGSGYNTYCQ